VAKMAGLDLPEYLGRIAEGGSVETPKKTG
jgi:hypothetical protein